MRTLAGIATGTHNGGGHKGRPLHGRGRPDALAPTPHVYRRPLWPPESRAPRSAQSPAAYSGLYARTKPRAISASLNATGLNSPRAYIAAWSLYQGLSGWLLAP